MNQGKQILCQPLAYYKGIRNLLSPSVLGNHEFLLSLHVILQEKYLSPKLLRIGIPQPQTLNASKSCNKKCNLHPSPNGVHIDVPQFSR